MGSHSHVTICDQGGYLFCCLTSQMLKSAPSRRSESGFETHQNLHCVSLCHLPQNVVHDGPDFSVWVMGIRVCMPSMSAHLHMPPLHCAINYDTPDSMFTAKYVFGQHLTEPTASYLPCSLIYKQTTIQGQIGQKLKTNPREHFERSGGSIYIGLRRTPKSKP